MGEETLQLVAELPWVGGEWLLFLTKKLDQKRPTFGAFAEAHLTL